MEEQQVKIIAGCIVEESITLEIEIKQYFENILTYVNQVEKLYIYLRKKVDIKGLIEKGLDTIWLDGLFLPLEYQLDVLKLYANIDKLNEDEINNFIAKYANIPHGDEVLLKEDTII